MIWLPGHCRAPDSWLGDGVGGADDRTALTFRVPDIAERDVYVCGPEGWAEDVRRTTSAGRSPSRPLPCRELRMVTGVRRIVLWFMSTLTVVTLLFGYHTSTSPESATGATGVLASPADGASGTTSGSARTERPRRPRRP